MNVYMHYLTMVPISLTFFSFVESFHGSVLLVWKRVSILHYNNLKSELCQ